MRGRPKNQEVIVNQKKYISDCPHCLKLFKLFFYQEKCYFNKSTKQTNLEKKYKKQIKEINKQQMNNNNFFFFEILQQQIFIVNTDNELEDNANHFQIDQTIQGYSESWCQEIIQCVNLILKELNVETRKMLSDLVRIYIQEKKQRTNGEQIKQLLYQSCEKNEHFLKWKQWKLKARNIQIECQIEKLKNELECQIEKLKLKNEKKKTNQFKQQQNDDNPHKERIQQQINELQQEQQHLNPMQFLFIKIFEIFEEIVNSEN